MALLIRAATVLVFLLGLFVLIPRLGLIGSGLAGLASALVAFSGEAIAAFAWFRRRTAERPAIRGGAGAIDSGDHPGEAPAPES